jgi:hypothetical protein
VEDLPSWRRFIENQELLARYKVTDRELRTLEHLSCLGTIVFRQGIPRDPDLDSRYSFEQIKGALNRAGPVPLAEAVLFVEKLVVKNGDNGGALDLFVSAGRAQIRISRLYASLCLVAPGCPSQLQTP